MIDPKKPINLARYYRLLPTFPKRTVLIAASSYLASSVPLYLASKAIGAPLPELWFLLSLAFLFAPLADRLLLKGDPIFDLRRCYCVSFISSLLTVPSFLLSWILLSSLGGDPLLAFPLAFAFLLASREMVYVPISSKGRALAIVASFPAPLMLSGALSAFLRFNWPLFALSSATMALAVLLGLLLTSRMIRGETGVDGARLVRAFALNWVVDDPSLLEQVLHETGEDREVEADVLEFEGETGPVLLVVPYFHPGPLKNVGSSAMSSELISLLEEAGYRAAILHGASTHFTNLASRTETRRVLRLIVSALREGAEPLDPPVGPLCLEEAGRVAVGFRLGDLDVVFLGRDRGMEDLPQDFKEGTERCVVVDMHNSIGSPPSDEDLRWFRETIERLRDRLDREPPARWEIGLSRIPYADGMEIGGAGVMAFVIRRGDTIYRFVVFDSNNAKEGLSTLIRRELDAFLLTTDTHELVTKLPGGRGYVPLGEHRDPSEVLELARKALRKAEAGLSPLKGVRYRRIRLRARIAGRWLLDVSAKIPSMFRRTLTTMTLSFLWSALLSLFLALVL